MAAIVHGLVAFPLSPPRDLRVGQSGVSGWESRGAWDPTWFLGLVPTRALQPVCGSGRELTCGLTKQGVLLS